MEIVSYFDNPSRWVELTEKPEVITSFSFGMGADVHFVFCTLRPKEGEEVVIYNLPTSLFFDFERRWKEVNGKTQGR